MHTFDYMKKKYFRFNKIIENKISLKKKEIIEISNLNNGVNLYNNHIIYKNEILIKVYDRICNHAGGKIISKNNEHRCPLHNWKFNPETGTYFNGIKKKECLYKIKNGKIIIEEKDLIPTISKSKKNSLVKVRFFNHAFLKVETDNFRFATDPWAVGPAFNNGWFLKKKTKNDWINQLNNCDFIYISHNHPDHLHPLTLKKVKKDMLFLVPNFITKSTEIYLRSLGFNNIFVADFLNEYSFSNTNLNLSVLKSGDFREDSGIYFSIGEFTCLFSVDSNNINHSRFPIVDLYASSFAGGASGFPLVFSNYNKSEKEKIILAYELFTEQYYRWEEKNENIFIQYYQDSSYVIPFELYSNRNPFNPPRVTYDAIKLDGTFRLLDDSVGRLMTDIYDGTNLKYLIENSSVEEQKFIDQFNERVNYKWIYDLDYISLGSEDFWKENWEYIQKDKFLKYNLFRRLQMWDSSLFVQLDDYKNQLTKGKKILDSVIGVRESEIEIIYWVINKKE